MRPFELALRGVLAGALLLSPSGHVVAAGALQTPLEEQRSLAIAEVEEACRSSATRFVSSMLVHRPEGDYDEAADRVSDALRASGHWAGSVAPRIQSTCACFLPAFLRELNSATTTQQVMDAKRLALESLDRSGSSLDAVVTNRWVTCARHHIGGPFDVMRPYTVPEQPVRW